MFLLRDLLVGVLLPMTLTSAVLWAGWQAMRHRHGARDSRSWAGPLATGAGFMGGYIALFGRGEIPPLDATEWLLLVTPALILVGLLDSLAGVPLQVRVVSVAAAVPTCMALLLWPLLKGDHPDPRQVIVLVVAITLTIGWIAVMEGLASRVSATQLSAILFSAAAPAAVVLLLSGSQRLGQIGGVLAATQLAGLIANYVLGPAAVGRGVIPVFGILFTGLLLCGYSYAEHSAAHAILLLAAPLTPWLVLLRPRRFGRWASAPMQLTLVLAVAVGVLVWVLIEQGSQR